MFRDPVHGLIELRGEDRLLSTILETRAVQRLRRIKQMGFAWLVYPGAEHSRFGHALGAFHIAQRVVASLKLDEAVARHVKVAAMLHDIGHGPFSHAWEHVFPDADHEAWGARIVREDDELRDALDGLEPGLSNTIASFWDKSYLPKFARKLVSSQLDVDRLDYLLRDGHYSGAGYATFDLDWILHALRIEPVNGGAAGSYSAEGSADLVVDYRRGMYAVEQYLFARSYMYAQVYHHKTVRAAEWMFIKLMQRFGELTRGDDEPPGLAPAGSLARGAAIPVDQYLWLDDVSLTTAIDRWAGLGPDGVAGASSDPVLADLAGRLARRRLFKTFDLGDDPSLLERIRADVASAAGDMFQGAGRYYFHLDTAKQIGYLADADQELHVVGHHKYGTVTLSRLLEAMPLGRPQSTVRLVCAPELVDAVAPICKRALARVRGRR